MVSKTLVTSKNVPDTSKADNIAPRLYLTLFLHQSVSKNQINPTPLLGLCENHQISATNIKNVKIWETRGFNKENQGFAKAAICVLPLWNRAQTQTHFCSCYVQLTGKSSHGTTCALHTTCESLSFPWLASQILD